MLFEAHRGVSSDYPENTMLAFRAAYEEGYDYIEADPDYTKDGVIVMFHDWPDIRRICRKDNGETIKDKISIRDLSYDEVMKLDVGAFMGDRFKGTRITTLKELLDFSSRTKIKIKIDNRIQSFDDDILEKIFNEIEISCAPVSITSSLPEFIRKVVERFPNMTIHYDGEVSEEKLRAVRKIVGKGELYIWISLDTPLTSWVKVPHASDELCTLIKKYGKLGIWILDNYEELNEAKAYGADIIETTGTVKPNKHR